MTKNSKSNGQSDGSTRCFFNRRKGGGEDQQELPHDRTVRRAARAPASAGAGRDVRGRDHEQRFWCSLARDLDSARHVRRAQRGASSTSIRRRGQQSSSLSSRPPLLPVKVFGHVRSVTSKLTSRRFPGTPSRRRQGPGARHPPRDSFASCPRPTHVRPAWTAPP